MREAYLTAMGIVSWKKRAPLLNCSFFMGEDQATGRLILASTNGNLALERKLMEAIASAIDVSAVNHLEQMDPALLSNTEFNGVIILGKQMMSFLENNHIKIRADEKRYVLGPSLSEMLESPIKKAELWALLRSRLWR